jgi:hypothetical protein
VVDVRTVANGVEVLYANADGALVRVFGKSVIMACPKFIAAKVMDQLEKPRTKAIARLRYSSYLVANVLLNVASPSDEYDIYLIGEGKLPSQDARENSDAHRATDVVNAGYASSRQSKSVLTLYRALPYEGARGEILSGDAYARFEKEFKEQLSREILPALGVTPDAIHEIRLTRWGHPIPVAVPGLFVEGVFSRINKPFQGKVFFANQDNWAAPALETSVLEALRWAPQVRKALKKG